MGGADRLSAAREALAAAEAAAAASGLRPAGARAGAEGGHQPGARGSGDAPPGAPAGVPGGRHQASAPDPHDVARKIVLRQLSMGPRTRRQLEDKLREKGCDPQVAARVLDRMTSVGLVDDEAFAEMWVRSRQETKGLAAGALRHELRTKGVADHLVNAALGEIPPDQEKEAARALVARRLRTMTGLDREVQTRRLAGFLARKGYAPGVAYQVIREALDDLPEHARD
ncbi:regulatory protein RecX [Ornithinimicrobium sufpigmenti]|uniref:regulatory protein RecX n=1 Tax=Ornithinimicrobium sufpigmenti TaxID=2508882 RepID=UPI001035C203|nr:MULTISPECIES: regulatory protein RecX [unclassified Ornithinimicrobium]